MLSQKHDADLIIGSDGFLGRNLARRLKAAGRTVYGIGRAGGDLSDWPNAERLMRDIPSVDRIFHVVTRQRTGTVQYGMQGELLAINARTHLNVLDGWRLHHPKAKLISMGSSCAYPESDQPLPEPAYQAGMLHPSVKGYGLAKQVLAIGSQAYAEQYSLSYLHCILATLYGPEDHHASDRSHFVGALFHRAIQERREGKREFSVWGNPDTVREVLYVDDQIDAILAADAVFSNELLNCAANTPITVGEVARAVCEALDWQVPIVTPPKSFQGAGYKMLDSSRFLEKTGWRPRIPLVEGLRTLYAIEYARA